MADPRTAVVAEDDPDTRELIEMVLGQSGFQVVLAHDGPAAIEAVRLHNPLLTTLDVNMPGMDGFAVAKALREFSHTYLIMITSLNEEIDIIRGFEAGADDYLVKPFRPRELRARADSMLRRASYAPGGAALPPPAPAPVPEPEPEPESWAAAAAREMREAAGSTESYVGRRMRPVEPEPAAPQAPQVVQPPAPAPAAPQVAPPVEPTVAPTPAAPAPVPQAAPAEQGAVLRYGPLVADTTSGYITLGGRAVELSQAEAELLMTLMRTGRRVRSKADLVLAARGQQYVTSYFVNEADKRAVEVHVSSLRRKLGDDGPTPRFIETVRGVGYRMAEPS